MVKDSGTKPLVSVVITNYNYEKYINEAIGSVLSQTYKNLEIVIIDDGSTDSSRGVIKNTIKGFRLARLVTQSNMGVVHSRNKGIDISRGQYLLFVDGDDMIPLNYVEVLVKEASTRKLDVVYTNYERFGDEVGVSDFPEFNLERLKSQNFIHISALIRKDSIKDIRFDSNLSRLSHEDWDFYLNLAYSNRSFGRADSVKLKYRSHGSSRNLNTKNGNYIEDALRSVKAHVYILNKYNSLYPGTFNITRDSEMVLRWSWSHERLDIIHELEDRLKSKIRDINLRDKEIIKRDDIIATLDKELKDIKSSQRYRVGSVLAKPVEQIKRITGRSDG